MKLVPVHNYAILQPVNETIFYGDGYTANSYKAVQVLKVYYALVVEITAIEPKVPVQLEMSEIVFQ